jgi:calpain
VGGVKRPPPGLSSANLVGKTYEQYRDECLQSGKLFEDPDFPAVNTSIFYSKTPPKPFEWKRPTEITPDAEFVVGGASRFDVQQGELGDCWLLAATSCLCQYPDLFNKVVPSEDNHSFNPADGYCGIFRFRFWTFGKWTEVVVDDRLPTYNGRLVFLHSAQKNEYWSSLFEKAYAKLNGSYENLKGGSSSEAMEDFTGGITEIFDVKQYDQQKLYQIMSKAQDRSSLMGCSIDQGGMGSEAQLANGLVVGHAYSITGIKSVKYQGKDVPLVRVRNPWGNECEWKGAWSDKSTEWNQISADDRKSMGLTFDDDGEFWISFPDFFREFTKLEICHLGPDYSDDTSPKRRWEMTAQNGSWRKRVNAGGCRNFLDTFWTNPQYRIEIVDPDEDDDENAGTLIVGVLQEEARKRGAELQTIGYVIYKLQDPNCGPLDLNFFKFNASAAKSPSFINLREICGRHKLAPGTYCVVPSTFGPNEEGDFLIRLFTEKPAVAGEIDEETKITTPDEPKRPAVTEQDAEQEKALRESFKKIAGEDLEVDAYELQGILNAAFMKEFKFDGFSVDTCRSLVAMKDVDRSGKLGYDEFKKLWTDLRTWKAAFKAHDKDNSCNFNSYELRETLHYIGVSVSNATFNSLVQRYSRKDGKIYFDDYISCIARLSTMFDIFRDVSSGEKKAAFSLDEFIATTMYS